MMKELVIETDLLKKSKLQKAIRKNLKQLKYLYVKLVNEGSPPSPTLKEIQLDALIQQYSLYDSMIDKCERSHILETNASRQFLLEQDIEELRRNREEIIEIIEKMRMGTDNLHTDVDELESVEPTTTDLNDTQYYESAEKDLSIISYAQKVKEYRMMMRRLVFETNPVEKFRLSQTIPNKSKEIEDLAVALQSIGTVPSPAPVEVEHEALLEQHDLFSKLLNELRRSVLIESSVSQQIYLEETIEDAENKLSLLSQKLGKAVPTKD